jgi:hypothetical protein
MDEPADRAHRRAPYSAPPYFAIDEDHAQAHSSASLDPDTVSFQPSVPAKRSDRTGRQRGVTCRRNDVERAATKRAKRDKRAATMARRNKKASQAHGS